MNLVKLSMLSTAVLATFSSSLALAGTSPMAIAQPPLIQSPIAAPYLDVTVWPTPSIDTIGVQNGLNQMTLAFVTNNPHAAAGQQCAPAWAGSYPIDGQSTDSTSAYIAASIKSYKAKGGDVIISFGGEAGSLAPSCATPQDMESALETVVDSTGVQHLDFDIEGAYASKASGDPYHIDLRSQAIAALQSKHKNPSIDISLTLPVMPDGLTGDGISVLDSAISNGVVLSRVNGMTMDYGSSPAPEMGSAAQQAAAALQSQIIDEYKKYGITVTQAKAMAMVGVTPMIGQNDVQDETFSLADAGSVAAFASQQGLGELAFWSLNRDLANCSVNGLPACSMVPESNNYQFADLFKAYGGALGSGVTADPSYISSVTNGNGGGGGGCSNIPVSKDKEDQPWDATLVYNNGDTATFGNPATEYAASYWTCGDEPDNSAAWVSKAPPASGPQPWNANTVYQGTNPPTIVTDGGHNWQANFWNQHDEPSTSTTGAWTDQNPPTGPQQWVKTLAYPTAGTQVIHDNANWKNAWYANPGDEPGHSQAGEWVQQ